MHVNSGEFIETLLRHYKTRNLPYAIDSIAYELGYSPRTIHRLLFSNIYSRELLISFVIFLNIDPSKVFIK